MADEKFQGTTTGTVSTRSRDEIEANLKSMHRDGDTTRPDPAEVRAREREAAEAHERDRSGRGELDQRKSHAYGATDDRHKSSEELEREVARERDQITRTLDELRDRMSLGQMVDQAFNYARNSGGSDFVHNITRQVQANPLPVILTGIGIGWLMMGSGRSSHESYGNYSTYGNSGSGNSGPGWTERAGSMASGVREGAGSALGSVRDTTSSTLGSVRDTASSAAGGVRDTAASAGSAIRDTAGAIASGVRGVAETVSAGVSSIAGAASSAAGSASHMAHSAGESLTGAGSSAMGHARDLRHQAGSYGHDARDGMTAYGSQARQTISRMAHEQPLLLGAIGVALGAAVVSLFPTTRTEDELLGEASDALKERVRDTAESEYEHVKSVATEAVEAVRQDLDERGLNTDNLTEAAQNALSRTREAVEEAADHATGTAEQAAEEAEQKTSETHGSDDRAKSDATDTTGTSDDNRSGTKPSDTVGTSAKPVPTKPGEV